MTAVEQAGVERELTPDVACTVLFDVGAAHAVKDAFMGEKGRGHCDALAFVVTPHATNHGAVRVGGRLVGMRMRSGAGSLWSGAPCVRTS